MVPFQPGQPLLDLNLETGVLGEEPGKPGGYALQAEICSRIYQKNIRIIYIYIIEYVQQTGNRHQASPKRSNLFSKDSWVASSCLARSSSMRLSFIKIWRPFSSRLTKQTRPQCNQQRTEGLYSWHYKVLDDWPWSRDSGTQGPSRDQILKV